MDKGALKQSAAYRMPPLISVVVRAHDEGRLMHYTLKSINRAVEKALDDGVNTEVIIIADSATTATEEYLKKYPQKVLSCPYAVYSANYSDAGRSWNLGAKKAKGRLISIVPAGDLMGGDWLAKGAQILINSGQPTILHPEYSFSFGAKDQLRRIFSSMSEEFVPAAMVEFDWFGSVMMTEVDVVRNLPYQTEDTESFLGDTGWLWNCDTLASGISHLTVPETMHAKRWREQDLGRGTPRLLRRTAYLDPGSGHKQVVAGVANTAPPDNRKDKTLSRIRNAIDVGYRSRVSGRIRRTHPRLDAYLTSMRNETLHLFRPVELDKRQLIPEWLLREVRALHEIDLRVFFSDYLQRNIEHFEPFAGPFTAAYWYLAEQISDDADFLFLVPYMKNGGAEREIVNMIDVVLKADPTKKIKMLATEPLDSPWFVNLDKKVTFIESEASFRQLSIEEQGLLVALLCVQLQPKKIHLMNSLPGYKAIQRYGRAIHEHSKIFITIFSIDRTPEGRKTHIFTEAMQDSLEHVDRVFTDNQRVVDELTDLMAIEGDKFKVLYQPANAVEAQGDDSVRKKFRKSPIKVLWAGRIDRQKRPDLLVGVAELSASRHLEFEFHVYGSPAFAESASYMQAILGCEHIRYHGAYEDGLSSLPLHDFDVFLMTSEWEGMPNVMLEATAGSLLIIAPDVGGVGEFVRNGETGYLVEKYDDVDKYVKALASASEDGKRSREMIISAQELARRRHTQESYEEIVLSEKSYID